MLKLSEFVKNDVCITLFIVNYRILVFISFSFIIPFYIFTGVTQQEWNKVIQLLLLRGKLTDT